jgi:hypothetical protein
MPPQDAALTLFREIGMVALLRSTGHRQFTSRLACHSRGRDMSRKSLFLGVGVALLLVGGVAAALILLVQHEPSDYRRAALPPGEERVAQSKEFFTRFTQLMNDIQTDESAGNTDWKAEFTEQQINSFFDEGFVHSGIDEKLLPEGISEPRVALETDKLRLMFRYGSGAWSSVITIELHVWVASGETNVVCMELQKFRAGSLPISAQSLLDRISDALRRNSIDVTWYRHDGNPVAVLRFSSDPQRSTVQLKNLQLEPGRIFMQGSSSDGSGVSGLLPPAWRWAFHQPAQRNVLARN